MIGKLVGVVDIIFDDSFILDVSGVGYRVFCTQTLLNIVKIGDSQSLIIHTDVKEDSISLYGFANLEEKKAFVLLCSVSGVGSKVAVAILSHMCIGGIQEALLSKDAAPFKAVSGVGPKLAARIVLELQNKQFIQNYTPAAVITNGKAESNIATDAISALVNLGIPKGEGEAIIRKIIAEEPSISLSDLIRLSLKNRSNV